MAPMNGGEGWSAGLVLGTTYLLSIGPNNMMIIREALVRGRAVLVASLVLATYVALLLLCYRMTDTMARWSAWLSAPLSGLGIAAMIWFAALSIRASMGQGGRHLEATGGDEPLSICLRRVLIVVVLNPLVYVEFLLIPSGALGVFRDPLLRLEFIAGLIVMAALSCYGYAAGGRACAGLFLRRGAMRTFDFACGCLLIGLAMTLGFNLLQSLQS